MQGSDDSIGHVNDFIVDDLTWPIRYLVIDTNNWWVSKKVLIAPLWANRVSWGAGMSMSTCRDKRSKTAPSGKNSVRGDHAAMQHGCLRAVFAGRCICGGPVDHNL